MPQADLSSLGTGLTDFFKKMSEQKEAKKAENAEKIEAEALKEDIEKNNEDQEEENYVEENNEARIEPRVEMPEGQDKAAKIFEEFTAPPQAKEDKAKTNDKPQLMSILFGDKKAKPRPPAGMPRMPGQRR